MKNLHDTVARAVRIETDEKSGKLYIVFEITDEKFKQKIKNNWNEDMPLELKEI